MEIKRDSYLQQLSERKDNGMMYISIYDDETSSIVWTDNSTNTLFYVSGPYGKDTLIKIAENIQVKE